MRNISEKFEKSDIRRDDRRLFSESQRNAIWLAADGKCEICGTELEKEWHAHHIISHSEGGKTDVTNGQALCPECHINYHPLYRWQKRALSKYLRINNKRDFLLVSWPGTGKTRISLEIAKKNIERGINDFLIFVVPTTPLRRQVAIAAKKVGIHLDPYFVNKSRDVNSSFDGIVVTYQAIAANPLMYKKITSEHKTLVIFDEIHHCGEEEHYAWGRAAEEAFLETAVRRLLLSGTPFRTKGDAIKFVSYDVNRRCEPDFTYSYGEALRDGVVRPIRFLSWDTPASWILDGELHRSNLVGVKQKDKAKALASALMGKSLEDCLRKADADVNDLRECIYSNAKAWACTKSIPSAKEAAKMLEKITGEKPTIVTSDDPEAHKLIEEFSKSKDKWIVSVDMISEGVDIPQLMVGVYATNKKTDLYFYQAFGRLLRKISKEDNATAILYIPAIDEIIALAEGIEDEVDIVLEEEIEKTKTVDGPWVGGPPSDFTPLGGGEIDIYSHIMGGNSYDFNLEITKANKVYSEAKDKIPACVTVTHIAEILRIAGNKIESTINPSLSSDDNLRADDLQTLKDAINHKVGSLHFRWKRQKKNIPFREIHNLLNKLHAENGKYTSTNLASEEGLRARLKTLGEWGESGWPIQ